jgi:hypothetical protein
MPPEGLLRISRRSQKAPLGLVVVPPQEEACMTRYSESIKGEVSVVCQAGTIFCL